MQRCRWQWMSHSLLERMSWLLQRVLGSTQQAPQMQLQPWSRQQPQLRAKRPTCQRLAQQRCRQLWQPAEQAGAASTLAATQWKPLQPLQPQAQLTTTLTETATRLRRWLR